MKNISVIVALFFATACTTVESPKMQTVVCGIVDSLSQENIDQTIVKFNDGRRLTLDATPVEITLAKGKIYSFTVEDPSWWDRRGAEMHLVKTSATNTCGYDKEMP